MMPESVNILYVGSPYYHHNREQFTKKISRILATVSENLCVIGANEPVNKSSVVWIKSKIDESTGSPARYYKFLQKQVESVSHPQVREFDYDIVIVRISSYILPVIFTRLISCPEATIVTQVTRNSLENILTRINFELSNSLIFESNSVAKDWGADKNRYKIFNGATYVGSSSYQYNSQYNKRNQAVGYVGLLNDRKGVDNLLKICRSIVMEHPTLEIKIGGAGPLREETEQLAANTERMEYLGFIPDSEMIEFYNSLQLLVLPTNSEGLPNVALEAMACGTPVLATPVGGLPDIIKDGETGFLMEDNDPATIRENINRALSCTKREQISKNARALIEEEYRFESAVERYERILGDLV